MRIFVTPTHWYEESDIDPFEIDKLIEQYGENWREEREKDRRDQELFYFEYGDID